MNKLAILAIVLFTCAKTPSASAPSPEPQPASGPRVIFPDGFVVSVEVVADDELRAQGLMFRDQLRPARGMLFMFARDGDYPFWMKNTRIPLDMIWIDANRRVVGILENVPPCKVDDCPTYGPGVVARYVLEVGGGEAAKHKLKVGDGLQFIETDAVAR